MESQRPEWMEMQRSRLPAALESRMVQMARCLEGEGMWRRSAERRATLLKRRRKGRQRRVESQMRKAGINCKLLVMQGRKKKKQVEREGIQERTAARRANMKEESGWEERVMRRLVKRGNTMGGIKLTKQGMRAGGGRGDSRNLSSRERRNLMREMREGQGLGRMKEVEMKLPPSTKEMEMTLRRSTKEVGMTLPRSKKEVEMTLRRSTKEVGMALPRSSKRRTRKRRMVKHPKWWSEMVIKGQQKAEISTA